jgi:hypothetical protein
MREKTNFLRPFSVMLPVQSPAQKINRFALAPNQHYNLRYPGPRRGALAIVTNVGAGCGGRGSVGRAGLVAGQALPVSDRGAQDERRCNRLRKRFGGRARSAKPLGEGVRGRQNRVVLAPVAGVKSAEVVVSRTGSDQAIQFADDGDKTNSSPGRARHKPLKPSACGNAGLIR